MSQQTLTEKNMIIGILIVIAITIAYFGVQNRSKESQHTQYIPGTVYMFGDQAARYNADGSWTPMQRENQHQLQQQVQTLQDQQKQQQLEQRAQMAQMQFLQNQLYSR